MTVSWVQPGQENIYKRAVGLFIKKYGRMPKGDDWGIVVGIFKGIGGVPAKSKNPKESLSEAKTYFEEEFKETYDNFILNELYNEFVKDEK